MTESLRLYVMGTDLTPSLVQPVIDSEREARRFAKDQGLSWHRDRTQPMGGYWLDSHGNRYFMQENEMKEIKQEQVKIQLGEEELYTTRNVLETAEFLYDTYSKRDLKQMRRAGRVDSRIAGRFNVSDDEWIQAVEIAYEWKIEDGQFAASRNPREESPMEEETTDGIKLQSPILIGEEVIPAGATIKVVEEVEEEAETEPMQEGAENWLDIDEIVNSYFEAVIWTDEELWEDMLGDETDAPAPGDWDLSDVDPDSERTAREEIKAFISAAEKAGVDFMELPKVVNGHSLEEMLGHDFWLTRMGHGVGFSDRDYGGYEDILDDLAYSKPFEKVGGGSYITDDNKIAIM